LCRGYILRNGHFIGKNIFELLLNLNTGHDYKLAYKLSERHLTVQGTGRMNVKLAVQIFSNTVAKAISFCGERNYMNNLNWAEASIIFPLTCVNNKIVYI